jgi:cellobiose phosphorylase
MLGISRHGAALHVAPCIPSAWPGYEVSYRYGGSRYRIAVVNPEGRCGGVVRIELDGAVLVGEAIPLVDDGREHAVRVVMGAVAIAAA